MVVEENGQGVAEDKEMRSVRLASSLKNISLHGGTDDEKQDPLKPPLELLILLQKSSVEQAG